MTRLPDMNRRRFMQATVTTAALASLGDILAACSNSTGSSGKTVTIKYWDSAVTQGPYIDKEIKLFQQAHPDIKIQKTTQAAAQYSNLVSFAQRSTNIPDLAAIPQTPTFYEQIQKNWWLPMNKWADEKWRAKFPLLALHEGSNIFNGKLYSAPTTTLTVPFQLYINNDVFRKAGLVNSDGSVKIPRTWDDVTHAAEAITKKSSGQTYGLGFGNGSFPLLNWWLFVFIIGADCPGGPGDPDLRTGKYTFASNRNYADWIQLFKEWKTKNYIYPNSLTLSDEVARAYFERGKFGMTVGGVWNQAEWTQHQFTDYSLTTLITPNDEPENLFPTRPGGYSYAISAKAKYPDEAWAWFDWLTSPEAGKRWVQMGEDLSIYPQNNNPAYNTFKPFSQYVATAKFAVTGPDPTIRNPEVSYVSPQTVTPAMSDILTGYYTGQVSDLQGALKTFQDKSQKALDDAIKLAQQQGHKVSAADYVFADWDPSKPYITKKM
ncbi:sugar ABC transporter substrate-binding protein [Dictyobacter sp. S3.2.2.5]|uniref:Sugar ABC transporter substrate-binding protein n=1 Tax=Dictyobacter halimunensis TaxID=3026934 RepID=A0ABQ6FIR6_9CHLR|nr:sugar ABC transporter substrate-binding protein [Dictyobacter sp. S3.2.2.5]